ncbi:MAG: MFS transporter [Caldilineaceae bacterium]|nr:MFS transporter [Caldilineaceae bacterium]
MNPQPAKTTTQPLPLVLVVSSVIALSILGDSLLYNILPLEAAQLGISLPWVGVLLSINRLVRLISNAWASAAFERWGARTPFLVATLIGLCSTVLYGIGWGLIVFLGARLLWGIAWSGLRQGGYEAIWHGGSANKGRLTGLSWGVIRMGSALSVLAGGLLYDRFGYLTTLLVVMSVTALALPLAFWVRWPANAFLPHSHPSSPPTRVGQLSNWQQWWQALQSAEARWLIIGAALQFYLSGVVVSTTSLFLTEHLQPTDNGLLLGLGIGSITGILQGIRWLSDILFGPTIGRISDRFGQTHMAVALVTVGFGALIGLATLSSMLLVVACLLAYFLCDSGMNVTLSAAASGIALRRERPHTFIGLYTTATDLGSALGPLLAFSLSGWIGLPVTYTVTAGLVMVAIFRYRTLAQAH